MGRGYRTWLVAAGLAAGLAVVGCGGSAQSDREVKGVAVAGRLVQNGKALKLKDSEQLVVNFILDGATPDDPIVAAAEYNPADGSFVVSGPTGQGIPPGRYKVEVILDSYGGGDDDRRFAEFDAETTPLVAEVGADPGQHFTVDLGTRRVTRKE